MKKYDVMCENAKFIEEVELYEGIESGNGIYRFFF